MVSVCLPSDALSQHLPSYLGFSYLGHGVSLHGCSSKVQLLLLTLDEGYFLTAAPPDLECGVVSECIYVHLSESSCLLCDGFTCAILFSLCMNPWVRKTLCACCMLECLCACVHTYTMYVHISVNLCVCYVCWNFSLSLCVYIYSVYACIWESLFMSELTPNCSEDVRTGVSQHMDKHYNWASFLSFLLAVLSAFLPWERLFGTRGQMIMICHYREKLKKSSSAELCEFSKGEAFIAQSCQ